MQPSELIFSASVLLSVASLVGNLIMSGALLRQTRLKQVNDAKRDADNFGFERRLAYLRVRLDRAAEEWRRKADFAEVTLSSFYTVEAMLIDVREKQAGATRTFSDYRQAKVLIDQQQTFVSDLRLRKHTAKALFGDDGASAYQTVLDLIGEVKSASKSLAEAAYANSPLEPSIRAGYEAVIWSSPSGDSFATRTSAALQRAHQVFAEALLPPYREGAPD